jgi:hypothetical protein
LRRTPFGRGASYESKKREIKMSLLYTFLEVAVLNGDGMDNIISECGLETASLAALRPGHRPHGFGGLAHGPTTLG